MMDRSHPLPLARQAHALGVSRGSLYYVPRPVSVELMEEAVDQIRQRLLALGEREIPSRELGEMVMHALRRLDKVAYIRFASVHRNFEDVDAFSRAIREVSPEQRKK